MENEQDLLKRTCEICEKPLEDSYELEICHECMVAQETNNIIEENPNLGDLLGSTEEVLEEDWKLEDLGEDYTFLTDRDLGDEYEYHEH